MLPILGTVVMLLGITAMGVWIFWSLFSGLLIARPPELLPVSASLEGATVESWRPSPEELEAPQLVWAISVPAYSSQLAARSPDEPYSAAQATGSPTVYPNYKDSGGAWSSRFLNVRHRIKGEEYIELVFPETLTDRILIVETLGPGAVLRVDDLSDEARAVALWTGTSPPSSKGQARVLKLILPEARTITRIRVNLHSRSIMPRPQIDAVALVRSGE